MLKCVLLLVNLVLWDLHCRLSFSDIKINVLPFFFAPGWEVLRRSRCVQIFLYKHTHTHTPLGRINASGIE